MNEFMANINSRAGGPGGASGSGGAGGSGGTGGNANGTGVRGTGPTVPELTGCTYATFIKCDTLPFIGTEGAIGLCQWFERLESVFQIRQKLWVSKLLTIPLGVRAKGAGLCWGRVGDDCRSGVRGGGSGEEWGRRGEKLAGK
nr:putative reverse transcriptase domain-containing protein [Tanacetum cinerariifolium]